MIAPSVIRIAASTRSASATSKLPFSVEVSSKARQILVIFMRNEEINREFNVFDNNVLPQLEKELTLAGKAEILITEVFNAKKKVFETLPQTQFLSQISETIHAIN